MKAAGTYRDIKADIMDKITQGEWKPGSLIPGELELADRYGAARATVNRAMRELVDEGVIERKRKAGTRVRKSPLRQARFDIPLVRAEIEAQGSIYRYELVLCETIESTEWLRIRMQLPEASTLQHLVCLHFADDKPYQHEDRWINLALLPQARDADFSRTGPTEWLVATVPFSNAEMSFSATAADKHLAEQLGCSIGDPLLQTERSTWWNERSVTFVRLVNQHGYCKTTRY